MSGVVSVLAAVAAVLALLGVREFVVAGREGRRAVAGADLSAQDQPAGTVLSDWDRHFRRTRPGIWLARELDLAGLTIRPLVVALAGVGTGLVAAWAIWVFLAPLLAVAGLVLGYLAVRAWVRRAQLRRQEAIVAQLPELARVLANASYAGLSLPTALGVASIELAEPVRTELSRITNRLRFGASLETALQEFRERVGSREAGVLISTLVVSSRSGGSLVTALRGIADSLDQRKETRRRIRTTLSGPTATANLLVVTGVGMLLLLNLIQPGTVETMTRTPEGLIGLAIAAVLFAGGIVAIRTMARVDP